jgi:hypothetical protein
MSVENDDALYWMNGKVEKKQNIELTVINRHLMKKLYSLFSIEECIY